jgi:hypothetical protein
MEQFLIIVKGIAPFLYGLAALSSLWGIRGFLAARYNLTLAQFHLEREQASQSGGRAITQTIVSIQVIALIFFLSTTTYDAFSQAETPRDETTTITSERFATSAPVDSGQGIVIPSPTPEGVSILRTQPPSPTFAGTVLPSDDRLGCLIDQADIRIPNNGQLIYETTPITGVVNIPNFAYYRFEILNVSAGDSFFGVIGGAESDRTAPVPQEGPLGSLIPQNFVPGEYRFRLTVFDTAGVMQQFCEITIYISEPLPTPTPIGAGVNTLGN